MPKSRETVPEKASRISSNFRVIQLDSFRALVIGDHDTYSLNKLGAGWTCDCPWGRYRGQRKPCSHVLAAVRASEDASVRAPVARLASLVRAGLKTA
ncbi:MAG: SWIM zinc finger family protein [Armatimonadetes bacterium]|nr:SWIM zinc finger family protein [Armatimonadota bacterium]